MPESKSYKQSATITGINEALPIVQDSITSKVPLENDIFQLTLFSFDKDQGLSTHTSTKAVILTLLSGSMEFILDGIKYEITSGDSIYISPNTPHSLKAKSASRMQLIMINVWKDINKWNINV